MDFAPREIVVTRRPDILHTSFPCRVSPVSIRDERPRDANEISRPLRDCYFGLCRHRDASDCHHRLPGRRGTNPLMNVEKMRTPEVHVRNMVLEAIGEIALTVG